MSEVLLVYESMFGNTEQVAHAIAEGMADHVVVDVTEVGSAPKTMADNVQLLVVGGPTHAFSMSRPNTRQDAVRQAQAAGRPMEVKPTGIREWLDGLARLPKSTKTATFDTRVRKPRVPGSAAKAAEKRLRKLGGRAVAPAESFWVGGTAGPLLRGEEERARRWGARLARELAGARELASAQ